MLFAAAIPSIAPGSPPQLAHVLQAFAQTTQGIVSYRYTRAFSVSAGPMGRQDHLVFAGVDENGRTIKVRVLQDTIGEKKASHDQVATTEYRYEHPNPGDTFEAPYDPQYASEYTFKSMGGNTIAFTPIHPHKGTGSGTFSFDSQGDVVSYDYQPSVLPPHATSGTIIGHRAQVVPGYWAVTDETQTYGGHYAIFGASATVHIAASDFQRFPNLASAEKAISTQVF
jgi:hypothetical protein